MAKEVLTPKQNIDIARVFLNILGYKLKDDEFQSDSTMIIYDKENHICGFLQYNVDKVNIYTKDLEANYINPEVFLLSDSEDNQFLKYWTIQINFKLKLDNNYLLDGEMYCNASDDTGLGKNISCCPKINFEDDNLGDVEINILRNGHILNIDINNGNKVESIKINPIYSATSSIVSHLITEGKREKNLYPYYSSSVIRDNNSLLDVSKISYINKHTTDKKSYDVVKPDEDRIIFVGNLMNELDPNMQTRIKSLSELLKFNDTPILDNFISASLSSFSNDEINSLFGIEKRNDIYQNNKNTFDEAYFNIENPKQKILK